MSSEALAHGADTVVEIGAHAVHLVYKSDARDAILIGLAPYRFRLRLHTGHGVKNGHAAIQHAQRAFHFDGKVHVARAYR